MNYDIKREFIDLGSSVGIFENIPIFESIVQNLTIVSPALEENDNNYIPASSVKIYGIKNIRNLYNGLGKVLEKFDKGL